MPTPRSSSSSTSSSSSSSSSSLSSSISDENPHAAVLLLKSLRVVLPDIKPLEEPTRSSLPEIARIPYSDNFNYVMGLYRRLRLTFGGPAAASSSRWLFLLAFVIRLSSSHYTAWKDRRDVVLYPARMLSSTYESLSSTSDSSVEKAAALWLPRRDTLMNSSGDFSLWRSVSWELSTMRPLCLRLQKNFQIWHHRKEMLLEALAQMPQEVRDDVLQSEEKFDEFLSTHHCMCFADVDERHVCCDMLSSDSKNYHVWLHRSWFVHAFTFLLRPPSMTAVVEFCNGNSSSNTDNNNNNNENDTGACGGDGVKSDLGDLMSFRFNTDWASSCLQPTVPPCPLCDELAYTAKLIRDDCMNNSAWCHRFYLFEHDLIGPLLPIAAQTDVLFSKKILCRLCAVEMHFALQWCMMEPCNESSYVHARCVAAVCQTAIIRLQIHKKYGDALFLHKMDSIVSEAQSSHISNEKISHACVRLIDWLPWDAYQSSFSLLLQQLHVLEETVTPRAETLHSRAMCRDAETIKAIRQCRSQFLLDNTHQVYAARYHSLFAFLEQTWCCYFADEQRARVYATVPPEIYDNGIEAVAARIATVDGEKDNCVRFFLECEIKAAVLAGRLATIDSIRSKYWKNEVTIILHREYC